MLTNLRGVSPLSDVMSDSVSERNRAEKALLTTGPNHTPIFIKPNGLKNYSDKNGNEVMKAVNKGRKTFAFWTLVCLLFVLAIGNLMLTFTVLAVLRLGQGMESMEFLPEHNSVKFFGNTDFDYIYKKNGILESYKDTPMAIESENGSVLFNLQNRQGRSDSKLIINSSGVFVRGVNSLELVDPDSGDVIFSTASSEMNLANGVNNLNAKILSTKRLASPVDENLSIKAESTIHLRGAEGTRMESKELHWSADQDIYLKSINGSIILSGKEGVFVDVQYLPIAMTLNKTDPKYQGHLTGQFKVCVCMPQGKLFRIPVHNGDKITCSHINMTGDLNPCL